MVSVGTTSGIFQLGGGHHLDGVHVTHMVSHGRSWWAVDSDGRVWHDGDVSAAAPSGVRLHCVQATPSAVWLGADSARLFRLSDGGLEEDARFADGAPGRERWHTPWGGPPDVRSLSVGPDQVLYVNVHVGGIVRYDGTSLSETIDVDADVHQVVADPQAAGSVVAACALGLARSTDGHDFEIRSDGLHARYCRSVAIYDDRVFVSASRGPGGADASLYRGRLEGGPLQRCVDGLPESFDGNLDTHHLVAGPEGVFCGNGTTVWRSGDLGESWEVVAADLPTVTCLA